MFSGTPSMHSSSSAFESPSIFGQSRNPGSNLFVPKPFGGTTAFGSPIGGSIFGGTSTGLFGAVSSPLSSTSTFDASSTPAFGISTPAFGCSSSSLTGSSIFGQKPVYGTSSTPGFSFGPTPTFGQSTMPFGSSSLLGSTPSPFGIQSSSSGSSIFGQKPVFGTSSTSGFSFSPTPTFGQSTMPFGSSSLLRSTPSPFGIQSSSCGAHARMPTIGSTHFGQSAFGGQRGGSRVASYTRTAVEDGGRLVSVSAMPAYKDKSHEELRWEDYQLGDKGGIGVGASTIQSNPFSRSPTAGWFSVNALSPSIPSNPATPQTQASSFPGFAVSPTPLGTSASANSFWKTALCTPSPSVTVSAPLFGPNSSSSRFGPSGPPAFTLSPSILSSTSAPVPAFAFGPNIFSSTSPVFVSSPSIVSSTSAPGTDSGFSSGLSSFYTRPFPLFQSVPPSTNDSSLPISSAQTTGSSGDGGVTGGRSQSTTAQQFASQNNMAVQPSSVMSPFGTLPAIPQMSIDCTGSTPSLRYGISSIPVSDKQDHVRISSSLTIRHLSQRRNRLPARKYDPKSDGPKVPFFSDDHEIPRRGRAEALFIPRENPRALVIRPNEQWPQRTNMEKLSALKHTSIHLYGDAEVDVVSAPDLNGSIYEDGNGNSVEDNSTEKRDGADVVAMMPKLQSSNYYTEPQIKELAAKERAEPGSCCHIKNFVVGRHGYGSIKFLGETDVRQLDLESYVKFNNREVIVYMDESKKPPVGHGLNKPAEVTLLNIKCMDKKTGKQHIDGPKVDKYREMLIKKAVGQGAEFVSYDPVEGVWKFRVQHF